MMDRQPQQLLTGLSHSRLADTHKPYSYQHGFTLVEMLVVVMLVALLSSTVILGVNAIIGRQLQSQSDQLMSWLQWAQQASMLSGSNYGIAQQDKQLIVVAPLNGKWYQVVGLEKWSLAEGLNWELPDTTQQGSTNYAQVDIIDDTNMSQFLPFMVFSNVGLIEPIADIKLSSDDNTMMIEWTSGTLTLAGVGG